RLAARPVGVICHISFWESCTAMKIAFGGLELPPGKYRFKDKTLVDLADKFQPTKVSPYYFEFLPDEYGAADVIAMAEANILDLLIHDMEKIEARLARTDDPAELCVLSKCQSQVEASKPVCDLALDDTEASVVRALGLQSATPTVVYDQSSPTVDAVCRDALVKAGKMFFYTVGKDECRGWLVDRGADARSCAGRIHSDLARGFIKAELVSCGEMMTAHNMRAAREQGLTRLVDGSFEVPADSILEIRFSV
ncbi:MAG: DUF933 domain-containing protein, partial [Anaerolineae bacterium]